LALAGLHLGDLAAVEDHAADHLDVEVAHAHRALARLADDREDLGQQVVEVAAVDRLLAQGVDPRAQLRVGLELELGLEGADQRDAALVLLELLGLTDVERALEDAHLGSVAAAFSPLEGRLNVTPAGRRGPRLAACTALVAVP